MGILFLDENDLKIVLDNLNIEITYSGNFVHI